MTDDDPIALFRARTAMVQRKSTPSSTDPLTSLAELLAAEPAELRTLALDAVRHAQAALAAGALPSSRAWLLRDGAAAFVCPETFAPHRATRAIQHWAAAAHVSADTVLLTCRVLAAGAGLALGVQIEGWSRPTRFVVADIAADRTTLGPFELGEGWPLCPIPPEHVH